MLFSYADIATWILCNFLLSVYVFSIVYCLYKKNPSYPGYKFPPLLVIGWWCFDSLIFLLTGSGKVFHFLGHRRRWCCTSCWVHAPITWTSSAPQSQHWWECLHCDGDYFGPWGNPCFIYLMSYLQAYLDAHLCNLSRHLQFCMHFSIFFLRILINIVFFSFSLNFPFQLFFNRMVPLSIFFFFGCCRNNNSLVHNLQYKLRLTYSIVQ